MKILAIKRNESVICELANGRQIEITQIVVFGEEIETDNDVSEALRLLERYLKLIAPIP